MAEFLHAQSYILKNEGGYCEVPGDKGGETYCGIARTFYPNWPGWPLIDGYKPLEYNELIPDTQLTSLVNQFYKKQFWDPILADRIDSQAIATYLYDFYVNAMHNAIKCLQRILGVSPDGSFGPATLTALNTYPHDLLKELHSTRCDYYTEIAQNGNAKFLPGWLNRANDLYAILTA